MCRCGQKCWENFYWNCIEEKFCYDESIANYNPAEDEYLTNKSNGFATEKTKDNNNTPIIVQPSGGIDRHHSHTGAKIHEDDIRQVQTTCPILATEILKVFSNSQIFHDHHHQSNKKTLSPAVHSSSNLNKALLANRESDNEKLLMRLEDNKDTTIPSTSSSALTTIDGNATSKKIQFSIEGNYDSSTSSSSSSLTSVPSSSDVSTGIVAGGSGQPASFPAIREEEDENNDEILLKPQNILNNNHSDVSNELPSLTGTTATTTTKRLRAVKSVPHFVFRPASENDIFSISGGNRINSMSQISMTPEIPSISYSTLPKNYEMIPPRLDKYIDTPSLHSIQMANSARVLEQDLSMPRYFRKSDMIGGHHSLDHLIMTHKINTTTKKSVEKSKRLEMLRTKLPPLSLSREKSLKDKEHQHHHHH